ncbi:MAG: acyl-CoA dehydrogenase [Hyphomicrobiales bacterium]|nr:acyl-CoA dehydrogenase [Hyphomicrobiales bacterium]
MEFQAPVADILAAMQAAEEPERGGAEDIAPDTVAAIVTEAGRFATTELAPLNQIGDQRGAQFAEGVVTCPPGWREAYRRFAAAGWNAVAASPEWGGQGLPIAVEMAVQELWNAGSAAFATAPMLTAGAVLALEAHASPDLKAAYLSRLVDGTWAATMNLTEPQAGSDLGALRTRAVPAGDGTYRLTGQKVFISYGEHDLTDNIIHLVLARLPDAPSGTAGISMFLVPKILVGAGGMESRNQVVATGIESKLGLHGSPTCTMAYDEAAGFLVGEEHRGLACMFTMMNITRLTVGIQAVGVAERATQQAIAYARHRRQGRAVGWPGDGMSPIIAHPDVQAMLMRMKVLTAASRAVCHSCAYAIDAGRVANADRRRAWLDRAALLTPIAKAFASDSGVDVASLGIQVHGGAGYIEETGAAQHLRDVRVFSIYEGTNGIQAVDLVTRKLGLDSGRAVNRLIDDIAGYRGEARAANHPQLNLAADRLDAALDDLRSATDHMQQSMADDRRVKVLAGATSYLRLAALVLAGGLLARMAASAGGRVADGKPLAIACHFADMILGETVSLRRSVADGTTDFSAHATTLLSHSNPETP